MSGHAFTGQEPREQWHERCARCGCPWGERNLRECIVIERNESPPQPQPGHKRGQGEGGEGED